MLAPQLPFPPTGGAPMRNYQLLRHLSERHTVSVLAYGPPDDQQARTGLERICAQVRIVDGGRPGRLEKRWLQLASLPARFSYLHKVFGSAAMGRALDAMTAAEDFDVIQAESSLVSSFTFNSGAALLLDEHNIEYQLLWQMWLMERSPIRKLYQLAEFHKFRREEQASWERCDGCAVTSERERAIVSRHVPGKPTALVPNGVDLEYFQPRDEAIDPASIVFTGRLDYRPNADAVTFFVREILPKIRRRRPEVVFTLVGTAPPDDVKRLAGPHVVVTGRVADVRPYLARAAVAVVPVRIGAGTRLKVLEAMAMGTPVVSTSVGCDGLMVDAGHDLLVADRPDDFASEVLRVLEDRSLGTVLGARGRKLVEAHYGWASIARALESFHASLVRPGHDVVTAAASSAPSTQPMKIATLNHDRPRS